MTASAEVFRVSVALLLLVAFTLAWQCGYAAAIELSAKPSDEIGSRSAGPVDGAASVRLRRSQVDLEENDYLDSWAVEIDGGERLARSVARQHGFDVVDKTPALGNIYHLRLRDVTRQRYRRSLGHDIDLRRTSPFHGHTKRLMDDDRVGWAEQQHVLERSKRSMVELPNDPMFNRQWYLHNVGQFRDNAGYDHDILPVWERGFTGRGVTITIVDDGLEINHPDIKANYKPSLSHDFNGRDPDPTPRYDSGNTNKHGTRCAGTAAAARNSICGVGTAYNSNIGGVRLLDGRVTDLLDSSAISLHPQDVDIYSNSWGPLDNGQTVAGPGRVTSRVLSQNILKGRKGLGSIFMWASGVGGYHGDSCAYDGFVNSIYSIAISAGTDAGKSPWYAEPCAAVLATGLSSGNPLSHKVVTTDLHHKCTDQFSGTSAATPMMAGIVALLLQARPSLTWRDIQHLLVLTSRPNILDKSSSRARAEQGWIKNARGRYANPWFGFGLVNATALLDMAQQWVTVPQLHTCYSKVYSVETPVPMSGIEFSITTKSCAGGKAPVVVLEQVQLLLTLRSDYRGALMGYLTSPQGTRVQVVFQRDNDRSIAGFTSWAITSTFTWGEDPRGTWKIELQTTKPHTTTVLEKAQLAFHGTSEVTTSYTTLSCSLGGMSC